MLEDALRDIGRFIKFSLYAVPIMGLIIVALIVLLIAKW